MEHLNSISVTELVSLFNKRDRDAFGDIYDQLYSQLFIFTESLFKNTSIDPQDVIQDAFVTLWGRKNLKFDSLSDIKGYLYVSIRNRFKVHYNHMKVEHKVHGDILRNEDFYIEKAARAEVYSYVGNVLKLLPEECANVFKLFLDGYSIKEIAEMTGKKQSTIYNQKNQAVSAIRKRLTKDQLISFAILFPI